MVGDDLNDGSCSSTSGPRLGPSNSASCWRIDVYEHAYAADFRATPDWRPLVEAVLPQPRWDHVNRARPGEAAPGGRLERRTPWPTGLPLTRGPRPQPRPRQQAPTAGRSRWPSALVLAFMAVEVVAGLLASSLALLSDAAHMLTDAGALALALVAARLAARPPRRALHLRHRPRRGPLRPGQRRAAAGLRRPDRRRRRAAPDRPRGGRRRAWCWPWAPPAPW